MADQIIQSTFITTVLTSLLTPAWRFYCQDAGGCSLILCLLVNNRQQWDVVWWWSSSNHSRGSVIGPSLGIWNHSCLKGFSRIRNFHACLAGDLYSVFSLVLLKLLTCFSACISPHLCSPCFPPLSRLIDWWSCILSIWRLFNKLTRESKGRNMWASLRLYVFLASFPPFYTSEFSIFKLLEMYRNTTVLGSYSQSCSSYYNLNLHSVVSWTFTWIHVKVKLFL